jgi:hypothetical protein
MAAKPKKLVVLNEEQEFVFMDKSKELLEIGFSTQNNIVLFGPGGHGKSELTMEFFKQHGIEPYVITMGTGMTTDRLFGGLDIPTFDKTGKLEYLVENSFMNQEYVVFEELFDSPDFILEQLKDILSSKTFRNGTQVFPIKTKFIVCCTNRTREEFSKNMSLKALMERFPLELNVVWDNYTEIAYKTLLESKFGAGNVDPIIPYILQEYHKQQITISPRVAVTAYKVYQACGPSSLNYIAEFSKKPSIITDAIKKFQGLVKYRKSVEELSNALEKLSKNDQSNSDLRAEFKKDLAAVRDLIIGFKKLTVPDDIAAEYATIVASATESYTKFSKLEMVSTIMED